MKKLTFALAMALTIPTLALAQDATQVRRMFEAGRFRQVIDQAGDATVPAVIYTAAQSHERLGANDQAREAYGHLAALPEGDPWHFIGVSGQQRIDEQIDGAVESARQGVAIGEDLPEAHFQLGLVLAKKEDWASAAAAFDRAAELNPGMAYAHYYGGLMHYRMGRPARMANAFERFLKLAPEAPERPEVMQIMRTVQGR